MSSASAVLTQQRDLLTKFVGTEPLSLQDRFWHELLTFSQPLPKLRPADVEEFVHPLCAQIVVNNDVTHNFGKLLVHLVESLKSTPPAITDLPIKAVNTVYITRVFLKYFTEHSTGSQIIGLLCDPPTDESPKPKTTARSAVLKATIQALFEFIGTNKPSKSTYLLHLEVLNLLLVMTSTQLTSAPGTSGHETHPFLAAMMSETELAPMVLQALLTHYIERTPAPPNIPLYAADTPGMVSKVGSTAVSVLMMPFTLPYRGLFGAAKAEEPAVESTAVLMDISVLLVLVLVHHDPGTQDPNNPFRNALNTCRDTDYDVVSPAKGQDAKEIIRVPFSALYDTLGACLVDDRSTLLLYSLIHGNSGFLDYVLVRTDLDTLLLPLLQMLYNASNRTANQIYMLLIILLILSQDSSFNANIHKLILPGVPWYSERLLPKISLGSLLVVILIRTVKYNLSKLRDVYLHTNCLAALANMAPHVQNLNAYASQRLVSLFDMLSRKYTRLSRGPGMEQESVQESGVVVGSSPGKSAVTVAESGSISRGGAVAASGTEVEEVTEVNIYTDFLRIVLEIINAILTYALPRNPEVVYALLHRQELFKPFRTHPRFAELLENIETVLTFFNSRMDSDGESGEWSVHKVLEVVTKNARAWKGDGIKLFMELRFTYEEEAHPEDFFVPYVWSLVCSHSGIPWDPAAIALFPPTGASPQEEEQAYNGDGTPPGTKV